MLSKFEWQKTLRGAVDISDAEFRVLMMLSTYTDADLGNAHPGAERLANDTGVSVKWVRQSLASLVEKGYLALTRGGGRSRANVYSLLVKGEVSNRELSTPFDSKGGTERPERGNFATGKGVLDDPPSGLSSDPLSGRTGRARSGNARQRHTDDVFDAAIDRARARDMAAERQGTCRTCGRTYELCRRADRSAGAYAHEFVPWSSAATA